MIGEPPVESGADQVTVAPPTVALATTSRGADGTEALPASEGDPASPTVPGDTPEEQPDRAAAPSNSSRAIPRVMRIDLGCPSRREGVDRVRLQGQWTGTFGQCSHVTDGRLH